MRPKLIASHPNIIGLRDLQSVEELVKRLSSARRVLVVGNGGIALELIHEVNTSTQHSIAALTHDQQIPTLYHTFCAAHLLRGGLGGEEPLPRERFLRRLSIGVHHAVAAHPSQQQHL